MENYEWPPLTDCPQYKYGMLHPYLQKFEFEDSDNVEDSEYNNLEAVKKFLKQGYDVDCRPRGFDSPFRPVRLPAELKNKPLLDRLTRATDCAIEKISEATGKTYVLEKHEKAVETRNLMMLLTFTAREVVANGDVKIVQAMVYLPPSAKPELEEWRFKRVPAVTEGEGA